MTIADQVLRGNDAAIAAVQRLRALSNAGDPVAKRSLSSIGVEFFAKRYPEMFVHARAHYALLASSSPDDRRAGLVELVCVKQRAQRGDPSSRLQLAILRVLHGDLRRALPGEAQIGYHPMPRMNRPGVMFGQATNYPLPVIPPIPGFPALPGMPGIPGVVYQIPGYPPFTPQVISDLMGVLQRALLPPPPPSPFPFPFPLPPIAMTEPATPEEQRVRQFGQPTSSTPTYAQPLSTARTQTTSAIATLFR